MPQWGRQSCREQLRLQPELCEPVSFPGKECGQERAFVIVQIQPTRQPDPKLIQKRCGYYSIELARAPRLNSTNVAPVACGSASVLVPDRSVAARNRAAFSWAQYIHLSLHLRVVSGSAKARNLNYSDWLFSRRT